MDANLFFMSTIEKPSVALLHSIASKLVRYLLHAEVVVFLV